MINRKLATFQQLLNNIGNKVSINWYNFEINKIENVVGILKKYQYKNTSYVRCNDFKFAGIIPICVISIELMEEK